MIFDKWIRVKAEKILCYRNDLFDFPGVYVVYGNEEIVYIGQSITPRIRFFHHKIIKNGDFFKTPWGDFVDLYIKIKYSKKYGKEAMIEKRLIFKIHPKFNKTGLRYLKYNGSL